MCVDLYVCKSSWGEHVALFQGDAGPQEPFSRRCAFRPWRKGDRAKAREVWGLGSLVDLYVCPCSRFERLRCIHGFTCRTSRPCAIRRIRR